MTRRNAPSNARRNAPWRDVREIEGPDGIVATLYLGDCVEVMAALEPESIHAVVTDPPYELGFMGKAWDKVGGVATSVATWERARALLKPGGHLTAFAGSRTYHRIASAIEDADFEIRDQLMWIYGSGFPKSHDISKCIDKRGGVWRGRSTRALPDDAKRAFGQHYERAEKGRAITVDAQTWEGWGTALKPAHEPIALARKPFRGPVSSNVLKHGTGGLNVDACRIGDEARLNPPMRSNSKACRRSYASGRRADTATNFAMTAGGPAHVDGRWPANVMTDGGLDVLEAFPQSAREAIRFFYSPKADRAEREFGMGSAPKRSGEDIKGRKAGSAGTKTAASGLTNTPASNFHPTVKPADLMAWLIRLVTRPGGIVLDPFTGSGSTGIAAVRHGFQFVGIEQSEDYFEIACRRIQAAVDAEASMPRFEREIARAVKAVQLSMFEGVAC